MALTPDAAAPDRLQAELHGDLVVLMSRSLPRVSSPPGTFVRAVRVPPDLLVLVAHYGWLRGQDTTFAEHVFYGRLAPKRKGNRFELSPRGLPYP